MGEPYEDNVVQQQQQQQQKQTLKGPSYMILLYQVQKQAKSTMETGIRKMVTFGSEGF